MNYSLLIFLLVSRYKAKAVSIAVMGRPKPDSLLLPLKSLEPETYVLHKDAYGIFQEAFQCFQEC
jgi:hypothetical protein